MQHGKSKIVYFFIEIIDRVVWADLGRKLGIAIIFFPKRFITNVSGNSAIQKQQITKKNFSFYFLENFSTSRLYIFVSRSKKQWGNETQTMIRSDLKIGFCFGTGNA
jgi:hypothetical protein